MIQVNLPKIVSISDKNKLILDTKKLVVVEAAQGATGITGATELIGLTDVDIDLLTLADDDFLQYDALTQTWINSQITITADLSNLTDVNIVNLQDNDFLQYDLATQKWINTPIVLTADHGGLSGLADDDHTQYSLLDGRAGGQTLIGGTDSGDDLTLSSTSNATKGSIIFGTSAYDEVNNRLGIGITAPAEVLDVVGNIKTTGSIIIQDGLLSTTIIGNVLIEDIIYYLPSEQGAVDSVLKNDGSGYLSWGTAGSNYIFSTGLTNNLDTITADLSTGKAGGQSVIGGTAAGDDLYLSSTSNATKGSIITDSDIEITLGKKLIFKIS